GSSRFSFVKRPSRNGDAYSSMNVVPGSSTPEKNGLGTSWPNARSSQPGSSRSDPSSQPTYQSGWDPALTAAGWNGPQIHTGLIWARPPSAAHAANTKKNSPRVLARSEEHTSELQSRENLV